MSDDASASRQSIKYRIVLAPTQPFTDPRWHVIIAMHKLLSCLPDKRKLFQHDPQFLESWQDAISVWGGEEKALAGLWPIAAVVFKPETVAVGNIVHGLDLLEDCGATIIAAETVKYDREKISHIWKYQMGGFPPDRIEVMESVLTYANSLCVFLFLDTYPRWLPASIKVTDLKGPVTPEKRRPNHLRTRMGSIQSGFLNYLHTPDEPADIIRELGILFDRETRLSILYKLKNHRSAAGRARRLALQLLEQYPRCDFTLSSALDRLRVAVSSQESKGGGRWSAGDRIVELCHRIQADEKGHWDELHTLLQSSGIELSFWDRIVILCASSSYKREGMVGAISSCEVQHWEVYADSIKDDISAPTD